MQGVKKMEKMEKKTRSCVMAPSQASEQWPHLQCGSGLLPRWLSQGHERVEGWLGKDARMRREDGPGEHLQTCDACWGERSSDKARMAEGKRA